MAAFTASLTFIVVFGFTKALTNLAAGGLVRPVRPQTRPDRRLAHRYPSAAAADLGTLLGMGHRRKRAARCNQGLTWSTTIVMKIDLAGPNRRGLAMGFNEAAGYLAVATMGWATGALAAEHGLRPALFLLALAVAALGLGLSAVFVRETHHHARHEAPVTPLRKGEHHNGLTGRQIFTLTSFREKALSAASQAGMVNNLNDGLAWGLYPILFATSGLGLARSGVLIAIYPAVWGIGQMLTGWLSDR